MQATSDLKKLASKIDSTRDQGSFVATINLDLDFFTDQPYLSRAENAADPHLNFVTQSKNIIEKGEEIIRFAYSYRSISTSIPNKTFESSDQEKEFQEEIHKIFQPKLRKVTEIKEYSEKAIAFIVENSFRTCFELDNCAQQEILLIIRAIDVLMSINYLITNKASIINDYTRYKRENVKYVTKFQGEGMGKLNELQMFLSSANFIAQSLRDKLQENTNYVTMLTNMCSFLLDLLESNRFFLPERILSFKRVAIYTVFFADSATFNVFKSKKIIGQLKKLVHRNPFLALFMDCNLSVKQVFRQCINARSLKESEWFGQDTQHYLLDSVFEKNRTENVAILIKLNTLFLSLPEISDETKLTRDTILKVGKILLPLLIDALSCVSNWYKAIRKQNTFKLENRITEEKYNAIVKKMIENKKTTEEEEEEWKGTKEFKKKVLFNFNQQEWFMLIKSINFMKKTASAILSREGLITRYLMYYYYSTIQTFLLTEVEQLIASSKAKLPAEFEEMKYILQRLKDYDLNEVSKQETKKGLFKKKKVVFTPQVENLGSKMALPLSEDVFLLKCALSKILATNELKNVLKHKEQIRTWEDFYLDINYFDVVIGLRKVVSEISDTSFLWFKESNLAMSNCVQFPINLLPVGIMIEYISLNYELIEFLPCILEIYNDSGSKIIKDFKQKFLFDEIEAEFSLLFDRLLFKFIRNLVEKALEYVAYLNLTTDELSSLADQHSEFDFKFINTARFASRMKLSVLGRKINFNFYFSQQINHYLKEKLDNTIQRFENLGVVAISELKCGLEVLRQTCELINEYFSIESYESLFNEVNESVGIYNFNGRVFNAVVSNTMTHVFRHFDFKNTLKQFERNFWTDAELEQQSSAEAKYWKFDGMFGNKFSKLYKSRFEKFKNLITRKDIHALVSLLTPNELSYLINKIAHFSEELILKRLHPYFSTITNAIPVMKAPPATFGFAGAHTAIQLKLKPIEDYPPLRTHVLSAMKELGNALCFTVMVDTETSVKSTFDDVFVAYVFGNEYQSNFLAKNWKDGEIMNKIVKDEKNNLISVIDRISKVVGKERAAKLKTIKENVEKYIEFKERNEKKYFLSFILCHLVSCVYSSSFYNDFVGVFENDPTIGLYSNKDLTSVCNTLKFIICDSEDTETVKKDFTMFGESCVWAFSVLLFLINQTNRFKTVDFCSYLLSLQEKGNTNVLKDELSEQKAKKFARNSLRFDNVFDNALILFRNYCRPPKRFIEIKNEKGENEWKEDYTSPDLGNILIV